MAEIVPAIIPYSLGELEDKAKVVDGLVTWVHIDISDGLFAPFETWHNPGDLALLPGKIKIEVHLMVEKPEEVVTAWSTVADRVIVHTESTEHLGPILNGFEHSNCKLGLALLLNTPLDEVTDYLDKIDLVQLMSIGKIGSHGEQLDEQIFDKVESLRQMWPDGLIQVDGGVNLNNAQSLIDLGATSLAIGSAIWGSGDVLGVIKKFKEL